MCEQRTRPKIDGCDGILQLLSILYMRQGSNPVSEEADEIILNDEYHKVLGGQRKVITDPLDLEMNS